MGVIKAIKQARASSEYLRYYNRKLDERAILLEAGQGKHTDGNIFAILRFIETSDYGNGLIPYLVVTKDSKQKARQKLRNYGFDKAKLIVRNSIEYRRILATAKFLVTDNSFPPYFIKRKGQIYINTWHGTPLKQLGRSDITNSTSLANVQKNFLSSDYLLYPNEYTKDVMMRDYMIDRVFSGKAIILDYPRNDVLFTKPLEKELLSKYNPDGKRIIAYMPTWRGTGRNANIKQQINDSKVIIKNIEQTLRDDEILYVNFHFLIGNQIDFSEFEKTRSFPAEYETYDFLSICDTLISDYSSVMMDFAQTGREVIMYMYDYEEYLSSKGFYFDVKTLPFKQAYNTDELIAAIHSPRKEYILEDKYVGSHFGEASEVLMNLLMCKDDSVGAQPKNTSFVYIGNIERDETRFLAQKYIEGMSPDEKQQTVLGFEGSLQDKGVISFLQGIDEELRYIMFLQGGAIRFTEYAGLYLYKNYGIRTKIVDKFSSREHMRLLGHIGCTEAQLISTDCIERYNAFSKMICHTAVHDIPATFQARSAIAFHQSPKLQASLYSEFDQVLPYDRDYEMSFWSGRESQSIYARISRFKCTSRHGATRFSGMLTVKTQYLDAMLDDSIQIGSRVYSEVFDYPLHSSNVKRKIHGDILEINAAIEFTVPNEEFSHWYTNNLLRVKIKASDITIPIRVLVSGHFNYLKKTVYNIEDTDYVCEFKEDYMHYRLVIRNRNVTDRKSEQLKLYLAFLLHLLTPWNKKILLFEKNSSRYEESAAILYEKLMDSGYKNLSFILDSNYPHRKEIDAKYLKNIVNRFSFKHYYNLFAAKTILSSETLGHALEKGATNPLFKAFFLNGSKNYVFLQHGVMYMLSLNSEQRSFFNKSESGGKQRVVVSSQLEANHFTDNTNYTPDDVYICGLIKFDRSYLNETADNIVVMLTWRPWEYVSGISDIKDTGYYRMLSEIVECIPEKLRDRLIVLPHPLIEEQVLNDSDDSVWKYYVPGRKYDEILRDAKLFISDYSSITYDAFYRGSNIVFYWKEKDQCMKEYGENARLMLTEDLAFGHVCYERDGLRESIQEAYNSEQKPEHLENFASIVEHRDGRNAERFIQMAEKDGIL